MQIKRTKTFRHKLLSRRPQMLFMLSALAAMLCFADSAEAQRRGGRGHGRSSFRHGGGRRPGFNRGGFGRRSFGRRHFGHRRLGNRRFGNRGFRRFNGGHRRFGHGGFRRFNRGGHRRFSRGGFRHNLGRGFGRHHGGHHRNRNYSKFHFPRHRGFSSYHGHRYRNHHKSFHHFGFGAGGFGYARPYPFYRSYLQNDACVVGETVVSGAGEFESSLERGRAFIKNKEYDRAADLLLQVVRSDAEAGLPKLLFGHALAAIGDYDYAAHAIRRALVRLDINAVMFGVNDLYHNAEEFDRLFYALHHHTHKHPSDPDAHLLLGYFRYFSGQYDEAIESLSQTLRYSPDDRHAHMLHELATSKRNATSSVREISPKRAHLSVEKSRHSRVSKNGSATDG